MTKITHLALLCAVVVIGMLIPPAMAVDAAPGEHIYRYFDKAQDRPDIDGDMIVWEDDRNGNKDIYSATIDEFRKTKNGYAVGERITDNPASQEKPSISGDHIVWQDNRNGNWDIYLYKRSTGEEKLLTGSGDQWMPAICENYVAWYDKSSGRTNIVLYDIAAGRVKDVIDCNAKTTIPGVATEFKPALSEKYLAWVEMADERIRYYDIEAGMTVGPVSASMASQSWPSLFGSLIAWEDSRNGNPEIYMTDLANPSEREQRITEAPNDQVSPAISASIITWEDKRDAPTKPRSIFMYDHSTGKEMSVFISEDSSDEQLYPVVSGNTIVWQRGRAPDSNLYIFIYKPGDTVREVMNITINPPGDTLAVNVTKEFKATAFDQSGKPMTDVEIKWSSSNETVGTIGESSGIFAARVAGTTTVTASAGGKSEKALVTVTAPASVDPVLKRIELDTTTATLVINETRTFKATAFDQDDKPMAKVEINWTSSNNTVGEIDTNGLFTAHAPGTTNVTAFNGNISANASVTVTAEPPVLKSIEVAPTEAILEVDGTQQFSATLRDQFGNKMTGIAVEWASSNMTVGEIDKTGLFTAHAPGTATVTAAAGDISETANVTVTAATPVDPVLKRIVIEPAEAALVINETKAFNATAIDQSGKLMAEVEINWTSSNTTVGDIDKTGLFTAHAAGTTDVIAAVGNISTKAAVTVTAPAPVDPVLSEIKVTPPRATLEAGDDQRFMATAFDQNHNVISAGKVVWTSSNETIGNIDEDTGLFTAYAVGTMTVTASAGGKSAEATVTVNAAGPALGMIAVSPSAVTLDTDDTLQFGVVAFDRFGSIVPDAEVTWESSNTTVGTIDEATGLFTAVCSGTTTLTATGDGASGTATITVNSDDPVLTSIVITPAAITLAEGSDATFTATAYGQNGCKVSNVTIDWSCSDECVGTIDLCSGSFSALDTGTATITATVKGVTATADVEVTDDCSGVVISPSTIILEPENKWQFRANVYDLQDNAAAPAVTWSCDGGGAGMITPDGLFTADCEGTATITATAGSETGTAIVTVRPATPPSRARIAVSPSDFTLAAGNNLTLTATVFDQCGDEIRDPEVTWKSSDENIGTIDEATGFFTALAEGDVTLTASAEGLTGSACVTVGPSLPVPTCIEVEPSTATLAPGETREFVATVFDQCDNTMNWVRVAWSCSDSSVGSIDRAGLFAAFAGGSVNLTAKAGGIDGTAAVTVTAAPVPDPTPTPTPTPGDNGGSTHYDWGDGGGATGPTFSAGIRENLKSGETFMFSEIAVTSVSSVAVTAADAIPRLMLTVKEAGLPSVASPPAGDTYEYVDISLYWANPGEISNATVTFTVTADWLEDHGMAPEDVRLMRYVNGGWQILETEVVGEEGGLYRFRATTPGFSTFAIAAAPENITTAGETNSALGEETNSALGEETNVTAGVTGTPEETGDLITTEATTVSATTTPATPLVYAPILAPLAFLLWRRKSH